MLWAAVLDRWATAGGHGQLRYVLAAATGFAVSVVVGGWLIRRFRAKEVFEDTTQPDHEGLNAIQSKRKRVPTMGGLMIAAGIVAALLLWADVTSHFVLNGILCLGLFTGLGYVDDAIKLNPKLGRGVTMWRKLLVQFVLAGVVAGAIYLCCRGVEGATDFVVPFLKDGAFDLGWGYLVWAVFVIVATSNAVNLADGIIDGLAGGLGVIASIALLGMSVLALRANGGAAAPVGAESMCVIAAATFGSVLGFLWWNVQPAQIFMGDTGSLALGALIGYIALGLKLELPLFVAGLVLFLDEMTVFLQIGGYKATKKRLFPIAPMHHYFQLHLKWPDQKITARLWIVAALGALAAFALIRLGGAP